jgi:hypothetical protein
MSPNLGGARSAQIKTVRYGHQAGREQFRPSRPYDYAALGTLMVNSYHLATWLTQIGN